MEQACARLCITMEAATYLLKQTKIAEGTEDEKVKELLRKNKLDCLRALLNIGLDETLDNTNARVAALREVLNFDKSLKETEKVNFSEFEETVAKTQELMEKYQNKLKAKPSNGTYHVLPAPQIKDSKVGK